MFKVAYVSTVIGKREGQSEGAKVISKNPVRVIDKTFKTKAAAKGYITRMGFREQNQTQLINEYPVTLEHRGTETHVIAYKNKIEWEPIETE